MLRRVLTPYRLVITDIGKIQRKGALEFAPFVATVPDDVWSALEAGVSGKVVPAEFVSGTASWRELVKARIHLADDSRAQGELHLAGSEGRFKKALLEVKVGDLIEIDPFGVTSKIESALTEATFFFNARSLGWRVTRMPENVAMHLGTQNYYDFRLEKEREAVRVELKSLWGTDTTKARLIHTKSGEGTGKNKNRPDRQVWRTSTCRFQDQDIFAVNMWLRTGRVTDFAYALSLPVGLHPTLGLPASQEFPEHVIQNPRISDPPTSPWTSDLEVAIEWLRQLRRDRPAYVKEILALRPS